MFKNDRHRSGKPWPKDCVWPEPLYEGEGFQWDYDTAEMAELDERAEELLEIRSYFDELVSVCRLNEDYSLNEDYDDEEDEFKPDVGDEYWDENRFDIEWWEDDLIEHLNHLKIELNESCPVMTVYEATGYMFVNENLLRQAFTRRAFAIEYGLSGCNEELEFLGDSILGSVVTREMINLLTEINVENTEAPFETKYDEGDLSKIRSRYVSKEYLSERAAALGLDKLILYGTGEKPTESSREDMMEALIGAVALDSGWNWNKIESVIDKLICVQLSDPDGLLKKTYYELFNSWHQSRFGIMPEYEVYPGSAGKYYKCVLRYSVPDNDKGVWNRQIAHGEGATRSGARENAAAKAYYFIVDKGLWMNLRDAGVIPDKENSINQLQELYQKKYLSSLPVYEFEEFSPDIWQCDCRCDGMYGFGRAGSKTKAKKRAAYMLLIHILDGAGICEDEWKSGLYEYVLGE